MKLYDSLMTLCEPEDSPFYFTDHVGIDAALYRIFLYRLAAYTDFSHEHALECRGTMFHIDSEVPELVSKPPEKFFNLGENPFTMFEKDEGNIKYLVNHSEMAMVKEDGSLISTFINQNRELNLKSKGSLKSDQALDAMGWLEENFYLKSKIQCYAQAGYTVNLEWTSPNNRIVLGYDKPALVVLNVRHNETGDYVDYEMLETDFGKHLVKLVCASKLSTFREHKGIEGYVVRLSSGQHVKLKTDEYCVLHHNKDHVNSPRRLFEACLDEVTDDLKQLFEDDQQALNTILDMEQLVKDVLLDMVCVVEGYWMENSTLSRKDYAIKAQKKLNKLQFGLTMMMYTGKVPAYRDVLKKNWRLYVGED